MYVEYLNKDNHTVIDGKNEYVFKRHEVKEIPDRVGRFLTSSCRHSFKKVHKDTTIIKNVYTNTLKIIDNHIVIHYKKRNERNYECKLSPATA